MVICGSRFPAEGRLMPRCTSGLWSRCSGVSAAARHFPGGLCGVHYTVGNTTHQPRALPAGDVPVQKVVLLKVVALCCYWYICSGDLHFICFSSRVCMARPVQCGDLQCITTVLNHNGPQIRPPCLTFFQSTYQCSVSIH